MSNDVWQRIEQARERWNVLEHPFYQRWSMGELSREELAAYSGQYRHATAAIARLSASVAESAPAAERAELRRHAEEEQAHIALWDGFVEAVGGEVAAAPTPETQECVDRWTAEDDRLAQLVRLYAIESGQPAISQTKREGLVAHYGIGDGPGNEYFRVHEKADVEHANEGRALIEAHLADADPDALVAAAESAFKANWRLLDGVTSTAA
ncbi:MAG TPA: iron-containing redox enzyme family protein [Solirubrobacterales bacterium]